MTESRPGYLQRHDVEPTEIGRHRALALVPPILVVWCASHLLTSVLCVHTSNRVKGFWVRAGESVLQNRMRQMRYHMRQMR